MTKKWSSEEPPCFKISTHTLYRYAINMLYSIRNSLPQTTHTLIVRHLDPLNHVNFFCYISTRAPKRCDTLNTKVTLLYLHFNPRSHTRCNEAYGNFMWITQISTRTPTQGATILKDKVLYCLLFQPTHPLRVRRGFETHTLRRMTISTHTPRKVWPFRGCLPEDLLHFNPRTHKRCDVCTDLFLSIVSKFQPAYPLRVRHY